MRVLILLSSMIFVSGVQAETFSAEEKKCGKGIYCVEEMICIGKIDGQPPKGMDESFYVQLLGLHSAKSVKNGAKGKELVDTLTMSDASQREENITFGQARAKLDPEGTSFGSPARIRGKSVKTSWTSADRGQGLDLKIVSSETRGGQRLDKLQGTEKIEGSVVGSYTRSYECEATVVEAPSKLIDQSK